MRAVVQRVSRAAVRVDSAVVGAIDTGLCILLCAMAGDTEADCAFVARKLASLRIFTDAEGRMNRSVSDTGGSLLCVSQFTLAADTTSGTRPSFSNAAAPEEGERWFERTVALLREQGLEVATGVFGAKMEVELVNDGPVTILLDSRAKR
jgi:D-tyrosyl-tRNA(Tyr) deacylase